MLVLDHTRSDGRLVWNLIAHQYGSAYATAWIDGLTELYRCAAFVIISMNLELSKSEVIDRETLAAQAVEFERRYGRQFGKMARVIDYRTTPQGVQCEYEMLMLPVQPSAFLYQVMKQDLRTATDLRNKLVETYPDSWSPHVHRVLNLTRSL